MAAILILLPLRNSRGPRRTWGPRPAMGTGPPAPAGWGWPGSRPGTTLPSGLHCASVEGSGPPGKQWRGQGFQFQEAPAQSKQSGARDGAANGSPGGSGGPSGCWRSRITLQGRLPLPHDHEPWRVAPPLAERAPVPSSSLSRSKRSLNSTLSSSFLSLGA